MRFNRLTSKRAEISLKREKIMRDDEKAIKPRGTIITSVIGYQKIKYVSVKRDSAVYKHVRHRSRFSTNHYLVSYLPGTNKFYRISGKGAVNLRGSRSARFPVCDAPLRRLQQTSLTSAFVLRYGLRRPA